MCAQTNGSTNPSDRESKAKAVLMSMPFAGMAGLFAFITTEMLAPINMEVREPAPVAMSMPNALTLAFALNTRFFEHGGKMYDVVTAKNAGGCHDVAAYMQVPDLEPRGRRADLTIEVCDSPKEAVRVEASAIPASP